MSATEKTFEREPRYLVIKVNDALAHLSSSEIYALSEMGEKITKGRSSAGKLPLVAVVVEQDWPEFELVWEMIKARVTGKGNDARRVVACLNACEGISTETLEGNVLPVVFEPDTTANNLRVLLDVCERMQRKADVFDSMIGEEMGVGIDDWREFVDAVAAARQALDAKKGGAE